MSELSPVNLVFVIWFGISARNYTTAWSMTPPLTSAVLTVKDGEMSVEIGFNTLLTVN